LQRLVVRTCCPPSAANAIGPAMNEVRV
jgi:hypothetical protein